MLLLRIDSFIFEHDRAESPEARLLDSKPKHAEVKLFLDAASMIVRGRGTGGLVSLLHGEASL